jgi:hypothetical protein
MSMGLTNSGALKYAKFAISKFGSILNDSAIVQIFRYKVTKLKINVYRLVFRN